MNVMNVRDDQGREDEQRSVMMTESVPVKNVYSSAGYVLSMNSNSKSTTKSKAWRKRKPDYGWVTVTYRCKYSSDTCIPDSPDVVKPGLSDTDLSSANTNT